MAMKTSLRFDNRAIRELPVEDTAPEKCTEPRTVPDACFSRVMPQPLRQPQLVTASESALQLLGLNRSAVSDAELADAFSGNDLPDGAEPAAHCYCGRQFGNYAGQLGDGAAMYIGEVLNADDERWEMQLKGAGRTPYSRMSDGRKVLRSSLREYLCSEAMHALGVPTTRAGTLVTSDSYVVRDQFYNGNPKEERCSVVLRIAQTFLRFGSFEICRPSDPYTGREGPSAGKDSQMLPPMLDYAIGSFYPEIAAQHGTNTKEAYRQFMREVTERTARLVAKWQCVGFCHGVLNTDNMSILGLTIDYGPFGFMERFDPDFICNASDDGGRYSYVNQPEMCKWNLQKFAETISEVVPENVTQPEVSRFDEVYRNEYMRIMRKKLGLTDAGASSLAEDQKLVDSFLETMAASGADFTRTFRHLLLVPSNTDENDDGGFVDTVLKELPDPLTIAEDRRPRMSEQQLNLLKQLQQRDPNMLAMLGGSQEMIENEERRLEAYQNMRHMSETAKWNKDKQLLWNWVQSYKRRLRNEPGIETDSGFDNKRKQTMQRNSPKYVLRNWVAQQTIEAAESGNYEEVRRVQDRLMEPYGLNDDDPLPSGASAGELDSLPPSRFQRLTVT